METIVVNLFGGPGSRKSTMASSIFAELKWRNINCELASEYAKDRVWEKSLHTLDNQIYVFGKQHHRVWKLKEQTDVIICDSPLLLSIIYDKSKDTNLRNLAISEFNKCRNLNFYLIRQAMYNPSGRLQTESEAKHKDDEILMLLKDLEVQFKFAPGSKENVGLIVDEVVKEIEWYKYLEDIWRGELKYDR